MPEEKPKLDRVQFSIAIANIVIALAALATFFITWHAIDSQATTDKDTLTQLTVQASSSASQAGALNQQVGLLKNEVALLSSQVNLSSIEERPYIGIDASGMSEQLNNIQTDPNDAWNTPDATAYVNGQADMAKLEALVQARALPEQFNVSFSFTITNFGHLPAKYTVNMSQFNHPGFQNLFSPPNATGFISPNQTITINYQDIGYKNTDSYTQQDDAYEAAMNLIIPTNSPMFNFLQPTGTYQSQISVKYGLLNSNALNFQTVIKEQPYVANCSSTPTPGALCQPLPQWEVVQSN